MVENRLVHGARFHLCTLDKNSLKRESWHNKNWYL